MPCLSEDWLLLSCSPFVTVSSLSVRSSSLFCFIILTDILLDVLPSLSWCFVIYSLVFHHYALLLLTYLLSVQGTLRKLSILTWLLRVPLYLWDTTSLLMRLILSHLYELYLHCCVFCLFCIVLQDDCVVVSATHHLWFIFTEALMLTSDDALSDLFYLLMLACSRISGFRSCLVALLQIFIRSVLSYLIYSFPYFTAYLGLGVRAIWQAILEVLTRRQCLWLFIFVLAAGSHGGCKSFYGTIIKSSKKASGKGFVTNPHTVQLSRSYAHFFASRCSEHVPKILMSLRPD